ncbi:LPXTG cell wall anchor domain-containing protein [Cnuibacter sp. UC19_7]|uniref:LPXTG cell wall anchor domain-containing protein n=1 Tax=Cnuibacter sp. UC19_7 TaxID=3350166 RepID=UPI00366D7935
MRVRILVGVFALSAFLGLGVGAASAASPSESTDQPVLAQTGADFTPMLVTAGILLLVAGVAVVVAKFTAAKSSR